MTLGTNQYRADLDSDNCIPPRTGFFIACGDSNPLFDWDLSGSPEAHQNLFGSTPELCSGVHQKGCDLEGVEGAIPPTPNHSFKTMTAFNTDHNTTELLDQELTTAELSQVSGGLRRGTVMQQMQQLQLPCEVGQSAPDITYCEDGLH